MAEPDLAYDAVTFDYWNTLIGETDAPIALRRSLWSQLLVEAGLPVGDEALDAAFKSAWERFERRWQQNEPSAPEQMAGDAVDHVSSSAGAEIGGRLRAELMAAYIDASLHVPRELLPGAGETLERLAGLRVDVGVVCDVGTVHSGHLRRWLEELDVAHLVSHYSFSDEVGVFKPDPVIFEHALAGLGGVAPDRAAHVGDLRRTDVAGARQVGMTSVRYRGGRDDTDETHDEADHVIAEHLDLFAALRLG